jgi:thiamine-phosphate pyrophosphorylase
MPFVQIITDLPSVSENDLVARLRRAARLGADARARLSVQLRDPELPVHELLRLGRSLREITRDLGAGLIVNDRVDLALLLEADGVHLGRKSMSIEEARGLLGPGAWVSVSAHSAAEAVESASRGASAALLSPIFASPGKGAPIGIEALREARAGLAEKGLNLRLYALGGVTLENAAACFEAGADGVAAIRADLVDLTSSAPPRSELPGTRSGT